jgi:hypothetical protein
MRTVRSAGILLIGGLLAVAAAAQNAPKDMKAREAFFFPKAKAQPAVDRGGARQVTSAAVVPAPAATPAPAPAKPVTQTATLVSAPGAPSPLAFRYSIRRRLSNARSEEVDGDTAFRSGDAIKVFVTLNDSGYLYIAQQGSSGTWNVLFPRGESNFVSGYTDLEIPRDNGSWLQFDATPGIEHLFVAASRRPITDLEQVISASRGQTPAAAPRPASGNLQMAALSDAAVARLRSTVLTRDLTIEKIDTAAGAAEHAVYVATSTGTGSLVVADFKLQHRQ